MLPDVWLAALSYDAGQVGRGWYLVVWIGICCWRGCTILSTGRWGWKPTSKPIVRNQIFLPTIDLILLPYQFPPLPTPPRLVKLINSRPVVCCDVLPNFECATAAVGGPFFLDLFVSSSSSLSRSPLVKVMSRGVMTLGKQWR